MRTAPGTAPALALVLATACTFAEEDPVALVAARGPDAVDCGAVEAWGEPPLTPGWARACALAARGRGEGFRAVVSQAVADGADVIGWVGGADGGGWRLHYTAVFGTYLGGDAECVDWRACGAIRDRGPTCPTLAVDLCFTCE